MNRKPRPDPSAEADGNIKISSLATDLLAYRDGPTKPSTAPDSRLNEVRQIADVLHLSNLRDGELHPKGPLGG